MQTEQVERLPLFAGLSRRERRHIAEHADEADVKAGRRLASEGELAYEFFVIEEGTASVEVGGEHVGDLGPGDFFGEIGLLESEHRRTATVTATSPMTLVVMTGPEFRVAIREIPGLEEKIRDAIQARRGGG
jgi:CRP-like cAMP-binding protein